MLGYIQYGDGPRKPELGELQLLGAPFLTLRMGQSRRPGGPVAVSRAAEGAKRLRAMGVRWAVFPVDFPYTSIFLRQGISPVETLPLRRALAAPLVRRRLEEQGLLPTQAVVAISAERMSKLVADTVKPLALAFRYVLLHVHSGGEAFARSLRREYGVSLLLKPSIDQLDRADALLLFSPRTDLALGNSILCTLYPGGETGRGCLPLALPGMLADQVEPNCCRDQLAAALWSMGAITLENLLAEIPVDKIGKQLYNGAQ